MARAVLRFKHLLVLRVRLRIVEYALNRVRSPNVFPIFGREVVESKQDIAVLDQLGNGPLKFNPVGLARVAPPPQQPYILSQYEKRGR